MKSSIKKKVTIVAMAFLCFFSVLELVSAREVMDTNGINVNFMEGEELGSVDCNGIFTPDALDLIHEILGYFQVLAPMILIVMTAVDFGTAVISQDKDSLAKAGSKVLKRSIATVALFFVPAIVRLVIDLPGVRDALEISDDPLCGTMKSTINENQLFLS